MAGRVISSRRRDKQSEADKSSVARVAGRRRLNCPADSVRQVSNANGLRDTPTHQIKFDHDQLYHGNAALLIESLEVVQQTAAVILAALEPPVADAETTSGTEAEANDCPVHNPHIVKQRAADPPPVMPAAATTETEEEAAERTAGHEQRMAEYEAEQKRREVEHKAEFERQQKEYEAEQAKREKQRKARVATFERIIEKAPAAFDAVQTRVFLRLLILMEPYSYLEEVASHFASGDENTQQSDDEIVLAALDSTADEKLNGLALRIVLADHIGIPQENQPDLLTEAETVFAPKPVKKPKPSTAKKPTPIKAASKSVKKAVVNRSKKVA